MKKPDDVLLKLVDLGRIRGIRVEQKQTSTDTADTFVELFASNGTMKALWSTVEDYLRIAVGYDYIAEVHTRHMIEVKAWRDYEQANKDEYAEYQRMKAKFES